MKVFITLLFSFLFIGNCNHSLSNFDLKTIEKERVLTLANTYLDAKPITVADFVCERSAGGINDFYSEGDYWWPDSDNPDGPYIRKDGLTNPENFTEHRKAMIRLSQISGALASAYIITKDEKYVRQLIPHLKAWFIDNTTKMNPNLLFGQAIMGRVTGRGIGIIDTIHLMEVALAIKAIEDSASISKEDLTKLKSWFSQYLTWLTTHEFGIKEKNNGNNHSVCWATQVAVFATLTANNEVLEECRIFYKNTLLPDQMDEKGAFPLELARTKPYGYSLFNLDAMTTLCQVLSTKGDNLFNYKTKEGKYIELGISFLFPYIKKKEGWPYKQDVMYWEDWPVRQPTLLFGGLAFKNDDYLKTWKSLDANLSKQEIIRNVPVRYPLLWFQK